MSGSDEGHEGDNNAPYDAAAEIEGLGIEVAALRTALAAERERAEKAEAERNENYAKMWNYRDEAAREMSAAMEVRAALAVERERCAKIAEAQAEDEPYGHAKFRCVSIAAAIRATGE